MKMSISLFMSDILPYKKKLYHKIVKSKIFKDKTTDDVFRKLKKIGFDGFELLLPQYAITTNEDILEIKKLTEVYKFPVLSIHQAIRFLTASKIKEIARLFEIADMLQVKVIVLHINSARKLIFDEKYVKTLHELEEKYHVQVAFENMEKHIGSYVHGYRWNSVKFSDLVARTGFHITFDVVHLVHSQANCDIFHFYTENRKRISNIHLSDYRRHALNSNLRPMRYKHMPLGDGQLPIGEFLSLLQKEKYKGLVTLEVNTDMSGVERSMALIQQSTG